jgi:putative PIN family toxin of toxin-antitoxin system
MNIVIDTNIFISALIKKEGLTRTLLINSDHNFLFPEYEFQEIYKYKEEILRKSGYSDSEFITAISALLNNMKIVTNEEICKEYNNALQIMEQIDKDDTIFIAAALAFNAVIWSEDAHFKMQNKIKVLNTLEMRDYS